MISIYKATCHLTGHAYIGVTKNLTKRLQTHRHDVNHGSQLPFHRAIRKYGWDAFELQILTTADDKDRDTLEIKFISEHNTMVPNGYNVTAGGGGVPGYNRPKTIEHKQKIGNANRGKKRTIEMCMRQSLRMKGKVSPMKGRHHSIESKQKITDALRGKIRWSSEQRIEIGLRSKGRSKPVGFGEHLSTILKGRNTPWLQGSLNHSARTYKITLPDNSEQIVNDLVQFCKNHGIKYQTAAVAVRRGTPIRQGYFFAYV